MWQVCALSFPFGIIMNLHRERMKIVADWMAAVAFVTLFVYDCKQFWGARITKKKTATSIIRFMCVHRVQYYMDKNGLMMVAIYAAKCKNGMNTFMRFRLHCNDFSTIHSGANQRSCTQSKCEKQSRRCCRCRRRCHMQWFLTN